MITLIATFTLAAAGILASAVRRVPAGQVHSLYRQGKPVRWLQPGRHIVMPLLDRVAHRIDLAGQVLALPPQSVGACQVAGKVYWQVLDPEQADALIEDVESLIRHRAAAHLAEHGGAALADARELALQLKHALNATLCQSGMMATRVELVQA